MGIGLGNVAGGFVEGYRKGSAIQDAKADREAKKLKTKLERADADRADAVREYQKTAPIPDVDDVSWRYDPAAEGRAAGISALAAQEAARKQNRPAISAIVDKFTGRNRAATAASSGIGVPPPPVMADGTPAPVGLLPGAPSPAAAAPVAAKPYESDIGTRLNLRGEPDAIPVPAAPAAPAAPAPGTPGLGVSPTGEPVDPNARVDVSEAVIAPEGKKKLTKSQAALRDVYALREIGDTKGAMEAYKTFDTERTKELSLSIDGATDDQLGLRLAEAYNKGIDAIQIKKDADGTRHVFVDGEEAHTFATRGAMQEYVKGVLTNNPDALSASMKMDAAGLQQMAAQAGLQRAAQAMADAARQGRIRDRKEFRDEADWQRAQAIYDKQEKAAEVFSDPDAPFTRKDEYKAAVEFYASPQSGMAKTEATFEDTGDTSQAGQRHGFSGERRVAAITNDPYFKDRTISTFRDGKAFAVRNPQTGKYVAARNFDHAQAMAKAWYPGGPPNAPKKK